jgi:AcrR family transcriptional regulator
MDEPVARRYSGRPVEEWKAARRERLLATAFDLFGTSGYHSTSIERLCSTAKVSTRHFYQEFPNKEAVLLAVYTQILEDGGVSMTKALAEAPERPLRVRLSRALSAYLETVTDDPRRARISFVEVVGASTAAERRRLAFRELVVATIVAEGKAAVERGEIRDRDFRFFGLSLIGAVNMVVFDWMARDPRPLAEPVRRSLVDLVPLLLSDPPESLPGQA